jgi:hypothetical protein
MRFDSINDLSVGGEGYLIASSLHSKMQRAVLVCFSEDGLTAYFVWADKFERLPSHFEVESYLKGWRCSPIPYLFSVSMADLDSGKYQVFDVNQEHSHVRAVA